MIKNILVPIASMSTAGVVLETAIMIARKFNARVEVLSLAEAIPYDINSMMMMDADAARISTVIDRANIETVARTKSEQQAFRRFIDANIPDFCDSEKAEVKPIISYREALASIEAEAMRMKDFDLIVVGCSGRAQNRRMSCVFDILLRDFERPVLLVPAT